MKVTIEVPDDLYRRVKAKTAAQGRRVREVSIELFERWIREDSPRGHEPSAEKWLAAWLAKADAASAELEREKAPSAREVMSNARSRLDRP